MLGLSSGLQYPAGSQETVLYSETFKPDGFTVNTSSASKRGAGFQPSNLGISINGSPTKTVYGSTNETNIANTKGWILTYNNSVSNFTGAGGGVKDNLGNWNSGSDYTYLFYESSSGGSSTSTVYRHLVTLPEIDLSDYTNCRVKFWFHCYGSAFGSNAGFGVAATTSATSSSSADQAGSGLGFSSDTGGGANITYKDLNGVEVVTKRIGSTGQVQTSGNSDTLSTNNVWIQAEANIDAAQSESSVYIHLAFFTKATSPNYTQDFCVDSIQVIAS